MVLIPDISFYKYLGSHPQNYNLAHEIVLGTGNCYHSIFSESSQNPVFRIKSHSMTYNSLLNKRIEILLCSNIYYTYRYLNT